MVTLAAVALLWVGIWYALHRLEYYIEMSDCEPTLPVAIAYQVGFPLLFVATIIVMIVRIVR